MNKTVSIHIQGFPFILEEQAYQVLQNYLQALKNVLSNEPGADDILQDVELRIVELLQQNQMGASQVILQTRIDEVIAVLGSPENFSDNPIEQQAPVQTAQQDRSHKRFFRDSDTAILGGVASGVAAYFNIDVVFVRVAFVLFTMVFGSGIPIYVLLWIIIPVAKTASEKLQMKGVPVNIESIKTEFKEATERIEKNANKWSSQLKTGSGLSDSARRFVDFIRKLIGALLVFCGLASMVSTSIFLFVDPELIPAQVNGEFTSLGELGALFFETSQIKDMVYLGVALVAFSIALSAMFIGFRLLLVWKGKWYRATLGLFGASAFIGLVLLIISGVSTAKSFAIDGGMRAEVGSFEGDSLQLNVTTDLHLAQLNERKFRLNNDSFRPSRNPDQGLILTDNGRIYTSGIEVVYTTSTDSLYHIFVEKKANGTSYLKANQRAARIAFPCHLKGRELLISSGFSYPAKDRIRDQEVVLQIAVPRGKVVLHQNKIVFPYYSTEEPERASDRAYIYGGGTYSAW